MSMTDVILLMINEKLYQDGEIDKDTKEKIELEIKTKTNNSGTIDL